MASRLEHLAEVRSDEAGASGDEDGRHDWLSLGHLSFVIGWQQYAKWPMT